jgi:hypothetical protein
MGNNHLFWPYKKDSNRPDQGIQKKKKNTTEDKTQGREGENKQETTGKKNQKPKNREKPRKQRMKPEEAITRKT